MKEDNHTCEIVLQAQLRETFGYNLADPTLHLDILVELGKLLRLITQTPNFLLKFDREGDDVCWCSAVFRDPFYDAGEVFVLLAEVVFHA